MRNKYYFAYGSNMSQARLESRVGKVTKIGTCSLPGYQLVFNAGWHTQCFANLIKTGNWKDAVEGVIYELTPRQMKALDGFEGAPGLYTRFIEKAGKYILNVYISINMEYTNQRIRPEPQYLNYLVIGCRENGLGNTLRLIEQKFIKKPDNNVVS
jgi:hypothetical protein